MDGYENGTISPLISIDYGAHLEDDTQREILEGRIHDALRKRGFCKVCDLVIQFERKAPLTPWPDLVIMAAASADLDQIRRQNPDESYHSVLAEHRAVTGPKLHQGRSTRAIGTPLGITQTMITMPKQPIPPQSYLRGTRAMEEALISSAQAHFGSIDRHGPSVTKTTITDPDPDPDPDNTQDMRILARFQRREGPVDYVGEVPFDLTLLLFKIENEIGVEAGPKVGAAGDPPQTTLQGF